ncbi:hypothetical protein RQP46_001980 [Phenoliferia psychrophenolica]
MLSALGTKSGLALATYRMGMNPNGGPTGRSVLAEVGSLTLELTRLSQVTGDPVYFEAVSRATDCLDQWLADERLSPALFPTEINPEHPSSLPGVYSFGGQADSYYEYLIKEHQLLQGAHPQYPRMYEAAIDAAHEHLIKPIRVVTGMDDMVSFGDVHFNVEYDGETASWYSPKLVHSCVRLGVRFDEDGTRPGSYAALVG